MKKQLIYSAVALTMSLGFVSCSDDDGPDSRLVEIGFEGGSNILAGPTSYGANLYYGYDGTQFTEAEFPVTDDVKLHIGINESVWSGEIDFYGGGMALSQWNIRTNPADKTAADWWYSYQNQCSVYNLQSGDGTNKGAGAGGSDTFVIANGYSDPNSMSSSSRMYFTGKAEFQAVGIDVCNSSYVYGVLMNGNPYGNDAERISRKLKAGSRLNSTASTAKAIRQTVEILLNSISVTIVRDRQLTQKQSRNGQTVTSALLARSMRSRSTSRVRTRVPTD